MRARDRAARRPRTVLAMVVVAGLCAASLAATAPAAAAPGDAVIYGVNAYGFDQVVEINLTEGTSTLVGEVGRPTQAADQDPTTGRVYFYEWRTSANEFGYWDPDTDTNTIVRRYAPRLGFYAKRMAFGPDGVLYMMDDVERLYTIDHTTGDVTLLGQVEGLPAGSLGGTGDMAFAPDGTLYVATYRSLYSIDVASLTPTLIADDMIPFDEPGILVWTGLAFCDGLLYGSHVQESTRSSGIFSIDPSTGDETLLFQTPFIFNDLTSCPAFGDNETPVADDAEVSVDEDSSVAVTLTGSDGDGDALSFSVVSGPSHGVLSGTAPNLTYTPVADFNGADSFTFVANDGTASSVAATVSVTVDAVNDAPTAASDSVVTSEDAPVAITLAGADVDGDVLSFSVVSSPSNGSLSGTAPNLTYTPDPGFNGADSFTFVASDGVASSSAATVSIVVTEVNEVPVADDAVVSVDEDSSVAVTLTGSDGDGDVLSFSVVSGPSHGVLSGVAPDLTYTPDADLNGADSFTFTVSDGVASSGVATVSITVDAVNDAPTALADSVVTSEDTPVAITLAGTDIDGDALSFSVVSGPSNGSLSGTAPNLTYTPDPGFNGADAFTFAASDGVASSSAATVSIVVTEVNEVPVADDAEVSVDEDSSVAVTLTGSDGDGDGLSFSVVSGPSHGVLSGVAPDLTYTPVADFNGADSFTFVANDGTASSAVATVSITVDAVNDAPTALADSVVTSEDAPVAITLAGADVDGDVLSFSVVSSPSNGSLSGTAPNLTFTPDADFNGADSFTFVASDGVASSSAATVSITVDAVNDAPTAVADSVVTSEDTPVAITLAGADVDGDVLSFSVVSGPSHGVLSGTAPNLTYTPDADFNGADSFTFVANDGTASSAAATVAVTVDAVNDAPTAVSDSLSTTEDTSVAITLVGADVDGDALTFAVVDGPTNGVLTGTAPNLTYTPNPGFDGVDTFAFTTSDGLDESAAATVTISVEAVPVDLLTYASARSGAMREVNLSQGSSRAIASLPVGSHAIARDPATGLLYALEWSSGTQLVTYDPTSGASTVVQTYSPPLGLFGTQMAFAPDGTLYLLDSDAALWSIDPVTGDLSALGAVSGLAGGPYGYVGDLAFAADGTAYVATYGNLYTLDLATRSATLVAADQFGTPSRLWIGLAHCGGDLYGADVNGATARSSIWRIDVATGGLTLVHDLPGYVTDLSGCATS